MNQIAFQKTLQTSTTQNAWLGSTASTPDGREWRYVKANEALTPVGTICTRAADTSVTNIDSTANNSLAQTVYITDTGSSWTAGQFQEGFGIISGGTGAGQFFKIKDNSATTLELYPDYAIGTALDTTSDLTLSTPYLVRECPITTLNTILTGVAQVAFAINEYGWILTRGWGVVLVGATGTANEQLTPGDDTAGSATGIGNGETPDDITVVGRVIVAAAAADQGCMVEVNIS